ncbi:nucleotidyltransferase family protein [Pseudaquidulcibacter saccharophilus]|uniref:nucleotidyltransferase family protein n=1 Tax=Pseudaquidulcibacter saccharophilus TaxID=2831900 RepID=UPI001EFF0D7A|nr:nucleotidyltransferase family protein [Pseudaquidulcibacter saccharophilus]
MYNICDLILGHIEGQSIKNELFDDDAALSGLINIARKNKLPLLLRSALLSIDGVKVPQELESLYRATCFTNMQLIHMAKYISGVLKQEGIDHFFYKGPLQQKTLYGNFFSKPSVDIDFNVRLKDFSAARELLIKNGFELQNRTQGIWWTYFLGEQTLFNYKITNQSVDIHHRLQQPGAPQPHNYDFFFENNDFIEFGDISLRVLNVKQTLVVAAMNMIKSLLHREHMGGHALDIIMCLRKLGADDIRDLKQRLRQYGLYNSVSICSRMACLLFKISDNFNDTEIEIAYDEKNLYEVMIANPQNIKLHPKRKLFMMKLCDDKGGQYFKELIRLIASDTAHFVLHGNETSIKND